MTRMRSERRSFQIKQQDATEKGEKLTGAGAAATGSMRMVYAQNTMTLIFHYTIQQENSEFCKDNTCLNTRFRPSLEEVSNMSSSDASSTRCGTTAADGN